MTKECSEEAGLCVVPHSIVEHFATIFSNCAGHLHLSTSAQFWKPPHRVQVELPTMSACVLYPYFSSRALVRTAEVPSFGQG